MSDKKPAIGDATYNERDGHGKIAHFTASHFPAINRAEIADVATGRFLSNPCPENMVWDEENKRWVY